MRGVLGLIVARGGMRYSVEADWRKLNFEKLNNSEIEKNGV